MTIKEYHRNGMTVRHDDEDEYQSRLCTKYGPRKLIVFSDHSGEMMVFSVPDNGDERMRTHYLYDIERILGTFEAIKEHEGKNATGIAKGVGYPAVIGRINEFMAKGLVRTYSLHRDIYLTPKG